MKNKNNKILKINIGEGPWKHIALWDKKLVKDVKKKEKV
jgi:hypothetical protein